MNAAELSERIYPEITATAENYETVYPPRTLPEGAMVTRLGPSPTGFIHLGNLYGAFVDERLAHQSGGIFYLRIEDTDDKRYVDSVGTILSSLAFFGIRFDEGVYEEGERGNYGEYTQSSRGPIYRTFAKKLLAEGKAYPCFLREEEIEVIREEQEKQKLAPGIYAGWSKYRDWEKDPALQEEILSRLDAGEEFVIRLRSSGTPNAEGDSIRRTPVCDGIRGTLSVPENFQDIVLIKASGIPTYHFAHVIDDHLMRTTHVVRGEEWLPSLPIHVELFEKLDWPLPVYCHTAQLMKIDEDGNKRKLSKRKDPELSLDYYRGQGYHPAAVREYLLTVLNSNYEEWRAENPEASSDDFPFTTEKMSSSGTLFDLNKLNDVSKDAMLHLPAEEIAEFLRAWSEEFAPEYADAFDDMTLLTRILDLGRNDKKPRKDLIYARQIMEFISYFFDAFFQREDAYPEEAANDVHRILTRYLASYDHSDDQETWFHKIRTISSEEGYAAKPKDYKKNPEEYKGHVGHVSTVIRIALMGRAQSPDVWNIQQIMGEKQVRARMESAIAELQ